MSLVINRKTEKGIHVDFLPGDSIQNACDEAIELAQNKSQMVYFSFNGVDLKVSGSSSKDELVQYFHDELARKSEEYRNSEQYQIDQKRQEERLASLQKKTNELIAELKTLSRDDDSIVKWIGAFAEVNDHMDLVYDRAEIINILESAGYKANAEVGNNAVKNDPSVFARWLIGQAIDNLARNMPIHPMATKFSNDYFELFKAA